MGNWPHEHTSTFSSPSFLLMRCNFRLYGKRSCSILKMNISALRHATWRLLDTRGVRAHVFREERRAAAIGGSESLPAASRPNATPTRTRPCRLMHAGFTQLQPTFRATINLTQIQFTQIHYFQLSNIRADPDQPGQEHGPDFTAQAAGVAINYCIPLVGKALRAKFPLLPSTILRRARR